MATVPQVSALDDPDYPSSDGKPMADNTKQFRWIVAVQGGLATQFADNANVLVVGDLLWYPVEGNNKIRSAPDAMVIFGRPQGDRGSYIQHREGGIAPQVAFEVLSPGNRAAEMRRKLAFYERYGIEEYYILDPDHARHRGYIRSAADQLEPIANLVGWISPRLGIRFELTDELRIIGTDGLRFEFYEVESAGRRAELQARQVAEQRTDAELQARQVADQRADAELQARQVAEQRADAELRARQVAEQRADAELQARQVAEQRADAERRDRRALDQENERLRARLRELGLDLDA